MIIKRLADYFFNKNPYKYKDVRVIKNTLGCWNEKENKWEKILVGLPYSFGGKSVTLIYMTGSKIGTKKLLFALLFRDDKVWETEVYPILVFSGKGRELQWEQLHSKEEIIKRIGIKDYNRIHDLSRLNWNICKIK